MTACFEFSTVDWDRIERDWGAWWRGELDRPLVTITSRHGVETAPGDDFLTRFPAEQPVGEILDYFERQLAQTYYYGDAYPKWWVNFGAGIMAAFLGSTVEYNTGTTWFHPLDVTTLDEIELRYDADNFWWRRVQAFTRQAAERWQGGVVVGHADLGGNLDILASLRGTQKLLIDTIEAPEQVRRLVDDITRLWPRYYGELTALMHPQQRGYTCWAPPWSPQPGYMLQSDFCYMISPGMFEQYVADDLRSCSEALPYPFYHMDGKGQLVHLDALLDMPDLRGIQWQPGDGQALADGWLDVLRRIREGTGANSPGKLCQVYVTREGALTITRELGGKGFLFDIINEGDLTQREAEDFLGELYALQ